jgi:hypothetical protein
MGCLMGADHDRAFNDGRAAYAAGDRRVFPLLDYVPPGAPVGSLDVGIGRAWYRGWDAGNMAAAIDDIVGDDRDHA